MISSAQKVSIVIRTLNESKYLGSLLDAIQNQTYKNVELIVVDSGSTDSTLSIASKKCQKVLEIETDDFTFGYAINYGIKHSTGELICILSAHTLPENDHWLEELVSGFTDTSSYGQIALSYGKQIGSEQSNFSEEQDYSRLFNDREAIQEKPNYFCNNANSMIRRELWVEHPFDEALTGLEDMEWSKYWLDEGYQIIYKPKAAIVHFHNEKADQIRRRFWREAIAARSIGVFPVWKILLQIPIQIYFFITDLLKALAQNELSKVKGIFTYRFNNLLGKLKSLTDKKFDLQDYREQYAASTYEVLEIRAPNSAHKTQYVLDPIRPQDVLIKIHYVGVCETDLEVLRGDLGYYKSGWAKYPIVPGHEFSGTIERVGSKVQHFAVGERVVGQCILSCGTCAMCLSDRNTACTQRQEVGILNYNGGYAEYVTLKSQFVHRIPENLSLISASSIEPLAVVHKGFARIGLNKLSESERTKILVVGGGPVGHFSARLGHLWGHEVTVFDKNEDRLALFSDISISTPSNNPDYGTFSVIIECTGDAGIASEIIGDSSASTSILLLGLPYDNKVIDLEEIVSFDKKIIGSVGSDGADFKAAMNISKEINMDHFNTTTFDFNDWSKAWDLHKTNQKLKVKLKIGHKALYK